MATSDAKYTKVEFNVFWQKTQPDRFHFATNDARFTDEKGERPGIRLVVSCNPRSADYNPATFNRLGRFFAEQGWDGPAQVPLHRRQLADRWGLIVDQEDESDSDAAPDG